MQRIRGEYTYFKELKNTGTAAYKRKDILREKLLKNLDFVFIINTIIALHKTKKCKSCTFY